ncbi:carboxymuconolactone decarboxylase family protein [Desertibaculum subflavum]|uniref:carboxymuconolactone decarboxylase family protein n=1 Tax=Desertibaculum subflavum TaxID=2268458 RepID=UPI000E66B231
MTDARAVRYEIEIPGVLQAMGAVHEAIDAQGLDRRLRHLVLLRASQINRCAHCVKMHTREARADGESSERLDRVIVFEQSSEFSAEEKAALAWAEALTVVDARTDYAALRARLRAHFSEREIGALTANIAMINLWNRLHLSRY